jgi:hypothetical protein
MLLNIRANILLLINQAYSKRKREENSEGRKGRGDQAFAILFAMENASTH